MFLLRNSRNTDLHEIFTSSKALVAESMDQGACVLLILV